MNTNLMDAEVMDTNLMDADETVRAWKAPGAGRNAVADHPAGQIRLRAPRRLGRRAELLSGPECSRDEFTQIPTITTMTIIGA
jgi:hypothetical protein